MDKYFRKAMSQRIPVCSRIGCPKRRLNRDVVY